MQSDNKFDNRFKQIFYDAEAKPPTDLFEKIEAEISGKKKKSFVWMAVAASIAAIIAIGLFWKLQAPGNNSNVVAVNQQKSIPKKDSLVVPANKIAITKNIAPQNKENDIPKKTIHHIEQKREKQIKNSIALFNPEKKEHKPNAVVAIDSAIQPKNIVINNTNEIALNNPLPDDKNQTKNTLAITNETSSSLTINNPKNAIAVDQPQQAISKKRKSSLFSKMITSIKDKAKDISETVYENNKHETTINIGFIYITKHKN